MRHLKYSLVVCLLLCCPVVWAASQQVTLGTVIKVYSGNIAAVRSGDDTIFVRLAGIDTPDPKQPYGREALDLLRQLVLDKRVMMRFTGFDPCHRSIALVWLKGSKGLDISSRLVSQGAAWVYRRYTNNEFLERLENEARQDKRGLWALADRKRLPPWEWRKHARLKGIVPMTDCRRMRY